jgi:proteasome lid subunit RPN8/RPN11
MVLMSQDLMDAIFEGAKRLYPKETILLLRGKRRREMITISDLVVPPLANYGRGYANIPLHMLPTDFSIIGTVHSHPSGNLTPSNTDLNHYLGIVLMIVAFPFVDERNVAAYNRSGEKLMLSVTEE